MMLRDYRLYKKLKNIYPPVNYDIYRIGVWNVPFKKTESNIPYYLYLELVNTTCLEYIMPQLLFNSLYNRYNNLDNWIKKINNKHIQVMRSIKINKLKTKIQNEYNKK